MKPTIVLVHGDWADASSWTSVIERLQDEGLQGRRSAQSAARTGRRRGVPRQLPQDDLGSDRARRPLVRRVRHHQRRHGQPERQGARLHRQLHARRRRDPRRPCSKLGLLHRPRAPSIPCLPTEEWICICAGRRTRTDYPGLHRSASPTGSSPRRLPSLPPSSGLRPPPNSRSPPGLRRGRRSRPGRSSGRWIT